MWRQRLADLHHNWRPLISGMVDAYLRWRYGSIAGDVPTRCQSPSPSSIGVTEPDSAPLAQSASGDTAHPNTTLTSPTPTNDASTGGATLANASGGDTRTIDPPTNNHLTNEPPTVPTRTNPSPPHPPDDPDGSKDPGLLLPGVTIEMTTIDIYTLSKLIKINVSSTGTDTTASALAQLGFIGNAPFNPSVAVSIKTLELYRVLRRRKPSFSIEAFAKVISDLYLVRLTLITALRRIHPETDPIPS